MRTYAHSRERTPVKLVLIVLFYFQSQPYVLTLLNQKRASMGTLFVQKKAEGLGTDDVVVKEANNTAARYSKFSYIFIVVFPFS